MLKIEVAAISGAPPPVPVAAHFDEAGGSIGRDPGCTLVLPDAEKRISRRHALINCRAGRYSLRNQGSAIAVLLNGAPLDYGAEAPLAGGDRIDIGDFSLRVYDESLGLRTTQPAARAASAARQPDVLADFGAPDYAADPFADLIPPPAPPPVAPPAAQPAAVQRRGAPPAVAAIPEDFDPFAEPSTPPPPRSAAARDDFSDLLPPPKERIDDLFGLHGGEPFPPGHPLAAPSMSATEGPVGIDDLLRPGAPVAPPPAAAPAQRDDAPELSARMRLPETVDERRSETPAPPVPAPPAAAGDAGPSTTGGMMLSWDEHARDGVFDGMKTLVICGGMPDRRQGDRRRREAPLESPQAPQAPSASLAAPADQKLLQALLEGLGLERWPDSQGVDAEAMRRLGRLLRAAVQGTIDLLRARASIKSEVQANMTMIASRDNNPLKFSPNAEAALAHLLGPTQRGFMSATAAMDDAYRDLVAHQFGFTAGTRAALAAVLERFDPAALEQRLATKSALDALLPAHRKGRLWDLFTERFAQISAEAEDDFQQLFGKAFLRAYEEQVAKMSAPRGRNEG